jgi:hypothetical protein
MANTNKHIATNYEKAFVEGEDCGMHDGCYYASLPKPTDADLEAKAERVFKYRGLTFESNFDGRMSFIAGYWQGYRKGIAPKN